MGVQLYHLYNQKIVLQKDLQKTNEQAQFLNKENKKFTAEINYFQDADNLEKELRSRFNYVTPGEKMIIIAPQNEL